ncbi:MAG: hypothetical protein IKA23_02240 [Akkermansia sp.]|nr:hypothetical protein [Akkermansia sp.]MBR2313360.1 hypothetical protein [Akkermansia sp.]
MMKRLSLALLFAMAATGGMATADSFDTLDSIVNFPREFQRHNKKKHARDKHCNKRHERAEDRRERDRRHRRRQEHHRR